MKIIWRIYSKMLEVYGFDWFWIRVIGIFLGFSIYFMTPLRTIVTDKVWNGFVQDFGNPALAQQMFETSPYTAGDSKLFLNYHHFLYSLRGNILEKNWLQVSLKLKLMFVIECVGITITLYVALATVMICLLVLDFIIRIL